MLTACIGRLLWLRAENEVQRILNTDDLRVDYDSKYWWVDLNIQLIGYSDLSSLVNG